MDENRHRHTVWMDDNVWVHVESHYQRDNCTTKNEFIEKAVRFYSGYLDAESAAAYLLRALSDVLEGKLGTGQTDGTPASGGAESHGECPSRRHRHRIWIS